MLYRSLIGSLASALSMTCAGAQAQNESNPDWSGQWKKPAGIGNQWDPTKPMGRGQQAPLIPEYQAVLEASLADQAAGGQGEDAWVHLLHRYLMPTRKHQAAPDLRYFNPVRK